MKNHNEMLSETLFYFKFMIGVFFPKPLSYIMFWLIFTVVCLKCFHTKTEKNKHKIKLILYYFK